MPPRRPVVRVLASAVDDVGLGLHRVRLLVPEERNTAANLHKTGHLRPSVELKIIDVANLFDFDEVRNVAVFIDASLQVACAGIAAGAPRDEDQAAGLRIAFKVPLSHGSINDWHHPALLDEARVELFDQVVVPEEVGGEGLVLAELTDQRSILLVFTQILRQGIGLKGAGHVVSVTEVEAFADFDLLEQVNVVMLVRTVLV